MRSNKTTLAHRIAGLMLLAALMLAACAPAPSAPSAPTVAPFPTQTPGAQLDGILPTRPPELGLSRNNPATVVAVANQPTATPSYGACPPPDASVSFAAIAETGLTLRNAIAPYLSAGGTLDGLVTALTEAGVFDAGILQSGYDLTGEGVSDLIISYTLPEDGTSILQVFVCEDGRYVNRYENTLDGSPAEVLRVGDMNNDAVTDVLYTAQTCSDVDGFCQYRSGIFTWNNQRGVFLNLLTTPPDGDTPPTFGDVDDDRVIEIITRQQGTGTYDTGPLRAGSQIYDWNGVNFVLSLSQPERLRYQIQALHEADRAFREERMDDAATLYIMALEDDTLGDWVGGQERPNLVAYGLYRLILVYTYAENGDALTVYASLVDQFANVEPLPIYAEIASAYWQTYQEQNNLNIACQAVQQTITEKPQALNMLNRYGTRSPSYIAADICPF